MWRASLAQKEDGASKQRGQPGILRQSIGSPFICMRVCLATPRTVVAHNPAELTSKADAQHTWQRSSACRELCAALRPQTPPRRQTAKRQVQSGPEEWSGRGIGLEDARLRLDRLIHRLNDAPFILRHRAEQTLTRLRTDSVSVNRQRDESIGVCVRIRAMTDFRGIAMHCYSGAAAL